MSRPRLLDLFCGAGGAAMGYHRAGFDVVGVDIKPQPHYPFEFIQADAMTWPLDGFDAIHASPPCQAYSLLTGMHGQEQRETHPDLVEPTRTRLASAGLPYVIENVEGAPLIEPVMLCGTMFGLGAEVAGRWMPLRRHRLFESGVWLWPPQICSHRKGERSIYVYGHAGGSSIRDGWTGGGTADWRTAMGVDWMTGNELAEAIPPAYTEFLGTQLLASLRAAA